MLMQLLTSMCSHGRRHISGDLVAWVTTSQRDPALHPRDLELNGIYSLARVHGSGVGQALLDEALDDSPAFLWTATINPRAQSFYRRNGFAADGVIDMHDMLGSPVATSRWVR